MSTYLYLVCHSHTPPLQASRESGQHLYDLPTIRADIANRVWIAEAERSDRGIDFGYFGGATATFVAAHEDCTIGIRDEYGVDYPLIADEAEPETRR